MRHVARAASGNFKGIDLIDGRLSLERTYNRVALPHTESTHVIRDPLVVAVKPTHLPRHHSL